MQSINHIYDKIRSLTEPNYAESYAQRAQNLAIKIPILLECLAELNRTKSLNNISNGKHLCYMLREYSACIEYLLSKNVNILRGNMNTGDTILHGIQSIESATLILNYIIQPDRLANYQPDYQPDYQHLIHSVNDNGETVLHCTDNEAMITLLLAHGAGIVINVKDNNSQTKLHRTYDKVIANILIQNGADINILNNKQNIAVVLTKFSMCELISFGINLDYKNLENKSVLMFLLQHGMKSVEEYFNKYIVDGTHQDLMGNNILHYANCFSIEALNILLKFRVRNRLQLDVQNMDGDTPLHIMSDKTHIQISAKKHMQVLIKYGSNVNIQNNDGNISKILLQKFNIKELENFTIDFNQINGKGQTVLMIILELKWLSVDQDMESDFKLIEYFERTSITNINHRDYLGNTLISYVSNSIIAGSLIRNHPNLSLNILNNKGLTQLDVLFWQKILKVENIHGEGIKLHIRSELLKFLLVYIHSIPKSTTLLIKKWNQQFKKS